MCFVDIYKKVEEYKPFNTYELLEKEGIDVIRDDTLMNGRQAKIMSYEEVTIIFLKEGLSDQEEENLLLHELGHYYFDSGCALVNHRREENNANLFMCLYLLKNDISNSEYHQKYLIDCGIDHKVANQINEMIRQYKMQEHYKSVWNAMEI